MKYLTYILVIFLIWLPAPARAAISIADLQLTLAVTPLLDDQYAFVITVHNAGPDFAEAVTVHFATVPESLAFDAPTLGLAPGGSQEYHLVITSATPFSAHAFVDGWFTDLVPGNNSAILYLPTPRQY